MSFAEQLNDSTLLVKSQSASRNGKRDCAPGGLKPGYIWVFCHWVHDNFVQRWLSSISSSPVIFIAMTKSIAPERNNGIGTFDSPMHS